MPHLFRAGAPRCEGLEPRLLLATFTVTNTNTSGPGSLYQAILDANATPDADVIAFDIGGPGAVKTISPTSQTVLPAVTFPVTIDGTTQPGYAGSPLVELSGARATTAPIQTGITLGGVAEGSVVRGLAIDQWPWRGIGILAPNCIIERNYLGTDATGMLDRGNGIGVYLSGVSLHPVTGTRIAGNVISGNDYFGIYLAGSFTHDNVIVGNLIGVNADATAALGNAEEGIVLAELPTANRIGGPDPADRNVICGGQYGVRVDGADNLITGNLIGVLPGGGAAGNLVGVSVWNGRGFGNQIRGNTIAFNSTGVSINGVALTAVVENSIYSNSVIGIDLTPEGPTPNDPGTRTSARTTSRTTPCSRRRSPVGTKRLSPARWTVSR